MVLSTKDAVAGMQPLLSSGTKQGVTCHPVLTEGQAVTEDQYDPFVDSLRADKNLTEHLSGLRQVYSSLLDSGFIDTYIGIHFDVNTSASYVTVVSKTKYDFDKELAAVCSVQ